ncbi:CRISPR-associated endonuclease Cas2 [Vacuolonema iberomarrocanum]|uniref:CRISPR-associated endonuclease Cas2 n=1 Tax=Vacuolonema iberomarrocanum TaxID=3454632 RepID=UPI0019ED4C6C|nr:CRISPR-associated endonuclease Cas2 [filamentous cyanobacterium LEGE 07170]
MLVLVVYDIPDDKRRTKLATFLEGYGRRVQYSVFECFMDFSKMQQLYDALKRRVKPEEDNVRLYWITKDSFERALSIGSPLPEAPPNFYIF